MDDSSIAFARLANQHIGGGHFKTATELVGWIGALQAQDPNMIKWAIGCRLPGCNDDSISQAFENGEILRTHALRPTWHLITSHDIYWILELTAPAIRAGVVARQKQLELTPRILKKSNQLMERALEGGKRLTRAELLKGFEGEGISLKENRSSHLLICAELDQLICGGISREGKHVYALLSERVPKKTLFSKEESLGLLAKKYFSSHGPATEADFCWWSGLRVGDARKALAIIHHTLVSERRGNQLYWLDPEAVVKVESTESVALLPSYDEHVISYKDRAAVLSPEYGRNAISNNGIFSPIIIINGKVVGVWKRTLKKEIVLVQKKLFKSVSKVRMRNIEMAAQSYGKFLDKKVEVEHH